ncbi:caspase family protein [Streptomyces netropsis]|uniref:caspase family protein n=1 Tax=Streptomyces netropsis TaxID=55404 RepID=UPI0030CF858F
MDGKRLALIVANDTYEDGGLEQLRSPSQDALALGQVLGDPRIGDFDVQVVQNQPAHVTEEKIEGFLSEGGIADLLLLHFSCHGLKNQSGKLYFAASNTRMNRLAASGISAEFVQQCMGESRSRSVVLFLDCCYAGAFSQGAHVRAAGDMHVLDAFDDLGGGRGRAVITATDAMGYSFEGGRLEDDAEPEPSVFTSALVEALETGKADRDEDGRISLNELYEYVFDQVRARNPSQTPHRKFDLQGDVVVARSQRRRVRPEPIPAALREALTDSNMFTRLGAVAELRERLWSQDLGIAVGAHEALLATVRTDIRTVSEAASRALDEVTTNPETWVDFGTVAQHAPRPSKTVPVGEPPIACSGVPESSDSWLRATESPDGTEISVDTSRRGSFQGEVTLRGPTGEAVIHVAAEVTDQPVDEPAPEPGTPEPAPDRRSHRGPDPEEIPRPGRPSDARAAAPAAPAQPPAHSQAKLALGLALGALPLSLFLAIGVIPAVFALKQARSSDAAINASPGAYGGRGLNTAARVIAWVAIGLGLLFLPFTIQELLRGSV